MRAVCRRFRRIADDGSLWERVALREPNDAAAEAPRAALIHGQLPEKARAAVPVRRICPASFRRLVSAFREQLEELHVLLSGGQGAADVSGLGAIKCASALRELCVGVAIDNEKCAWDPPLHATAAFTQPLSIIQFLSKLERLATGAPSLRTTDIGAPLPIAADLAAVSSLAFLHELRARFMITAPLDPRCISDGAAKRIGPAERENLLSVLLDTNVVFDDDDQDVYVDSEANS
eukprot:tig00021742_g23327.t1